jgi:hypothetical protein
MVGPQQPPQIYPLGQPESGTDPRFTLGVVLSVADVLAKHRFPEIQSGADILNLQQALFQFIYGPADDSGRRDAAFSDLRAMHDPWCPVGTLNRQGEELTCNCRGEQR